MYSLNNKVIVCLFSVLTSKVLCETASKKDVIGFPEREEDKNLTNKADRQPVFIPSVCADNELYYPGDQKDDWICDCRPAYIYHPATDKCWPAFRRGPCPEEQYLVLPPNSVLPTCENNPCKMDTYVPWNGKCEKLGSTSPCENKYVPTVNALGVNATNLVVSCGPLQFENRFSDYSTTTVVLCPPGCKRCFSGKCTPSVL